MNKTKIKFAFVGRLTKEKGFDLICDRLQHLYDNKSSHIDLFTLDVYGDGEFTQDISHLSKSLPNVTYHGHLPFDQVVKQIQDYDYNLMPSRFLETFGLTALDFALYGIPTIGFAKGGLTQFILDPTLDINSYAGKSEYDKFVHCMDFILIDIDKGRYADISKQISTLSKNYTRENWIDSFKIITEAIIK